MIESIKTVQQINHNECGLCVLKSLIKYHHNKNVEMNELINNANLSEQGISIYDLEILAEQYNIDLESYSISFDELKQINSKEKFILILNDENNLLHYVIAQNINKNRVKIYCSKNGVYELEYKELEKVWTNIYIKCNKSFINKDFKISLKTKFDLINWKYILLVNCINVLIVLLTIFGSTVIQQYIDKVIGNGINNLLNLSITFLTVYILQFFMDSFLQLFSKKYCFKIYHLLYDKTLKRINNKYHNFFEKVNYSYLVTLNNSLYEISSFYCIRFNEIIADSLIIFSTFIFLAIYSWYFLLIGLMMALICILIELIKFSWIKQNINRIKESENLYLNSFLIWLNSLKKNKAKIFDQLKLNELKNNFIKLRHNSYKQIKFNLGISLVDNIVNIFFFIITIVICCNLIYKQSFDVGKMMLVITILSIQIKSIKGICSIFNDLASLRFNKEIIKNIWNIANCNEISNGCVIESVNEINYGNFSFQNDTRIVGKSGSGKTTILKSLANLIKTDISIKYNCIEASLIDRKWIDENIIYIANDSFFDNKLISNLITSDSWTIILDVIKQMNLKSIDINKLSKGQEQALAFISLLNLKNKIILVDELLSNVDNELKKILLEKIKPEIIKNNFLIFVDHNINKKGYFKNEVIIDEKNN